MHRTTQTDWQNDQGKAVKRLPHEDYSLSLSRVISVKFPLKPHQRYYTSHSMKNLAFHSLLRWKMIILPILTTTLIQFSSKGWKNVLFWETAFWHKNLLLLITRNNLVEYHTIQLLHLILRCNSRVHLIFSPFRIRYLTSLRGHRKKKRVREIGKNDCPIPLFIRKCTYITVFHITSHNTARHDITPNISITYTDRKKTSRNQWPRPHNEKEQRMPAPCHVTGSYLVPRVPPPGSLHTWLLPR